MGMDALVFVCSRNTNGIMICAQAHERNYDLGIDALVCVCSRNTNGIMIWACMLWSAYALGTRTEL